MASKRWTWLTAVALLFAGLTNAHSHVHYCFDGKAPLASVHHVDVHEHSHEIPLRAPHPDSVSDHDDHGAVSEHDDHDSEHDDLDLDVPNDALAKSLKHDLPAIVATALWTASLDYESGVAVAVERDIPPAPDPRYTRPLLRAPPR